MVDSSAIGVNDVDSPWLEGLRSSVGAKDVVSIELKGLEPLISADDVEEDTE